MRKLLVFGLVVLALVVGLLSSYWFLGGKNTSDIKDDDLKLAVPVLAAEKNAATLLEQAANQLAWPEEQAAELQKILSGKAENPGLVSEILKSNQEVLALINQALKRGSLHHPAPPTGPDEVEYLAGWKSLTRLLVLESLEFSRLGKTEEAFESAWKILALGQMVEKSHGQMMHYLVANSIKSLGLRALTGVSEGNPIPGTSVKSFAARLNSFRSDSASLSNVIKMEYQSQRIFFDEFKAGRMYGSNIARGLKLGPPMYHHRRTRLSLLTRTRETLGCGLEILFRNSH